MRVTIKCIMLCFSRGKRNDLPNIFSHFYYNFFLFFFFSGALSARGKLHHVALNVGVFPFPYNHMKCSVSLLRPPCPLCFDQSESIMECPQNCHGNGDCLSGICNCFPGFLGPDCSRGTITHTHTHTAHDALK